MRVKILVIAMVILCIIGGIGPVLADSNGGGNAGGNGGNGGNGGTDSSSSSGSSSSDSGSSSSSGSDQSSSSGNDQTSSTSGSRVETSGTQSMDQSHVLDQSGSQDQTQSADQSRLQDQSSSQSPDQIQQQDQLYQKDVTQYFSQVQDRQQQLLRDPSLDHEQVNYDLALYSLSISGTVTGNESPNLTRLFQQIEQSQAITDQAQQQIRDRDPLTRTLVGGDAQAASTLLQTTSQNMDRIREMDQLIQNCTTCDPQIQQQLHDQLQVLAQNQTQLQDQARQEQNNKGWFGWLFR
jgi:hypothetical protein